MKNLTMRTTTTKRLKAKKNKRLVCFSTGSFYVPGQTRDINEDIEKCRNLNADGLEIMFPDPAQFMKTTLTKKNINFLRNLKFNTIHSPFHINWENNLKCRKMLSKLKKIYNQIEAKNIVFHAHRVKDYSLLKHNPDCQYSIETDTPGCGLKLSDYKKIFNNNPHLNLVLDTSHLVEHSEKHISLFIKNYKDRIIYTHLSAVEKRTYHNPLHIVSEKSRRLLNSIKSIETPVIIELMSKKPTIASFKREISFVRKWLK